MVEKNYKRRITLRHVVSLMMGIEITEEIEAQEFKIKNFFEKCNEKSERWIP